MKKIKRISSFGLALLVLFTVSAYAATPREELNQMMQQLQKTPNDNALREKVIKLGARIRPAIPEEANRAFVKGNVFQKGAKDVSGYDFAIKAYREALRVAPWWGDAYFNLAVALEAAGNFDEAITATKHYMASVPAGSAEAREAQNRIYAFEAKREMASRLEKKNRYEKLSGRWKSPALESLTVEIASDGSCTATNFAFSSSPEQMKVDSCKVVGDKLQFHLSSDGYRIDCEFGYTTNEKVMHGQRIGGGYSHFHKEVIDWGCNYDLRRP